MQTNLYVAHIHTVLDLTLCIVDRFVFSLDASSQSLFDRHVPTLALISSEERGLGSEDDRPVIFVN